MSTQQQHDEDEPLGRWQARLQRRDASDTTATKYDATNDHHRPAYGRQKSKAAQGPLIERISNKWQEEEKFVSAEEDDGNCANVSTRLANSRKARRMILLLLLGTALLFYTYKQHLLPYYERQRELEEEFTKQAATSPGASRGGDFAFGKERIVDLDPSLTPGGEGDVDGKRRLVFVGDIHGCKTELLDLLHKVGFDTSTDHLIATGDVVSKGPDSAGVLDELIRLDATSVRGNHEDRLLTAAETVFASDVRPEELQSVSKGAAKDAALLKSLHKRHMHYLHGMPLMLRIPALPHAHEKKTHKRLVANEILVVHAGLVPAVALHRQDPYFVMNMRSLSRKTHAPSATRAEDERGLRPWAEVWGWYASRLQGRKGKKGKGWFDGLDGADGEVDGEVISHAPQIVVYGHDSKAGLQVTTWTKGLDSGCVSGGRMTALVLDARGRTELFHVRCQDYKA